MRNLLQLALAIVLFGSCKKLDELSLPISKVPSVTSGTNAIENLGHVFTGTNVTWKMHPLDATNTPLFTYLPNQSSGFCLLMIDNGVLDGLTPINAFRFVAVNMQSLQSKIITVKAADGNPANYSFGRTVRCIFGMDKKFYVATEGSPTGGGHLIQYDPNTQTAKDLGKPFKKDGHALDIYTLNVGTDGALYGGSFGGDGSVMTFRYADNKFQSDQKPLDNTSRYVTSVSGDSRFTYAVCGKNNWTLYAIDRQTGEKRILKSNPGSGTPIDIASNTDAPYAHSLATHYKLAGFTITDLPEYHRPQTDRVVYVPYAENDQTVPKVSWDGLQSKLSYQLANDAKGTIEVAGLQEDIFATTGPMMYSNNRLYLSCYKQGLLGTYSPGTGFQKIGCTSMDIHTIAVPPANSPDANKVFLGGYPKGGLLQYTPMQDWNVNVSSFANTNGGYATTTSNPKQSALFQNADPSGINGSMSLIGIAYTKNGYVAGGGNNDRITASSGRELSMGSFKNGVVRNLRLPEFSNYEFQSLCLSQDSNYVYIGALPHSGNIEKLYKYNPATNTIVASWELPVWADRYTQLNVIGNDMLVGTCGDAIFLFDLNSGQITWKQSMGAGQKIYAMTVAPDHSVYINFMYRSPLNFKIVKFNFDLSNRSNIASTTTDIAELGDSDRDERTKPTGMLIAPGVSPDRADLYVSGLSSLYRIKM